MFMRFLAAMALLLLPTFANAQTRVTGAGFDLRAQGGLSFDAEAGMYRAVGEVQLVQGTQVFLADEVQLWIGGAEKEIVRLSAQGNLYFQSESLKVRADRAQYDVASQILKLDGKQARVETGEARLATQGGLSIDQALGTIIVPQTFALANGEIDLSGGAFSAEVKGSILSSVAVSQGALIEGLGVKAAAQDLTYDPSSGELRLQGAVVVQQAGVTISGPSARYNLKTGALSMDSQGNDRVQGRVLGQ